MKRLLKYLLLSIGALVSYSVTIESRACEEPVSVCGIISNIDSIHSTISSKEEDISVPRQGSSVNLLRQYNSSRRPGTLPRFNFVCVKSGKVVNSSTMYIMQMKSVTLYSSLIEPAHKLIYLRKFII